MEKSRHKGFTLIELLVVIAIIAVLAAILFPVFSAAKEKARITMCAGNMGQMGKGLMLYCDDYGRYPYESWVLGEPGIANVTTPFLKNQHAPNWCTAIAKYTKNQAIFACPSALKSNPAQAHSISYIMNSNVLGKMYDRCRHPTKTMTMFEACKSYDMAYAINVTGLITFIHYGSGSASWSTSGNEQGTNILYVDGHVLFRYQNQVDFVHNNTPFWLYDDTQISANSSGPVP